MARIGIEIPPGLTSDDTPFSTQQTYRYADHVRFSKGRAEVTKGTEKLAEELFRGVARDVLPWKNNIGIDHIGVGTNTHLYIFRSGEVLDITPADYTAGNVNSGTAPGFGLGGYGLGPWGQYSGLGEYTVKTWALSNFGEGLIASPRLGPIYIWLNDTDTPKAVKLSTLDGANQVPANCNFTLVTNNRQVIAFGCNQETDVDGNSPGPFNPMCIRGSDIDSNIAEWHVDLTNNSFETILSGGGRIVSARLWGQVIAVWTTSGMYVGQFTGDASVYRFDPIASAPGLLGPNAATIIGDVAYWLSPDLNLWACPLGGSATQINCPIYANTLEQVNPSQFDKVVMSNIPAAGELRIDYPHGFELENSQYVVFHIESQAWSEGIVSRTAVNKGGPLQFPISCKGYTLNTTHVGGIPDANAALETLLEYSAVNLVGENLVVRSAAVSNGLVAIQDNFDGNSKWGFLYAGDGSGSASAYVTDMGLLPNETISISYLARVKQGPNVTMDVIVRNEGQSADYTQTVVYTSALQQYKHEAIVLPTDATDVEVVWDATTYIIPDNAQLEITDIKVEVGPLATEWLPAPSDPGLFTLYGDFLRQLKYDQDVSELYFEDIGQTTDGGPLKWYLETNDFALDENLTAMLLTGFRPDFGEQQGTIYLTVYGKMNPQDETDLVAGPFAMVPGQDRVDFMMTAKQVRFRLEGNSAPASARFGRHSFDAVPTGKR